MPAGVRQGYPVGVRCHGAIGQFLRGQHLPPLPRATTRTMIASPRGRREIAAGPVAPYVPVINAHIVLVHPEHGVPAVHTIVHLSGPSTPVLVPSDNNPSVIISFITRRRHDAKGAARRELVALRPAAGCLWVMPARDGHNREQTAKENSYILYFSPVDGSSSLYITLG